jgi:predicted O-linked N-acetylglucosamine transferase (SPINDLY family)
MEKKTDQNESILGKIWNDENKTAAMDYGKSVMKNMQQPQANHILNFLQPGSGNPQGAGANANLTELMMKLLAQQKEQKASNAAATPTTAPSGEVI